MSSKSLKVLVAIIFILNISIGYVYGMDNLNTTDQLKDAIILALNQPFAVVNGNQLSIDNDSQITPVKKEDKTFVPVRFIAQTMGDTVAWNGTEQKVTISKENLQVELFIGKTTAIVNGSTTNIDIAPQIINARTYIPVETIATLFGKQVTPKAEIVIISDKLINLSDDTYLYIEGYFNGVNVIIEAIKTSTGVNSDITTIDNAQVTKYDTANLNRILSSVDESALVYDDKAKLKREIIRDYGFTNFDWKGTLDDVKAFTNLGILVVKISQPTNYYRRGYENEPTSNYGLGRWWGDKARTIQETRDELAVLENWGNPLTGTYQIRTPVDVLVLKGTAAPQVYKNATGEVVETRQGGGMQYFFNSVDNAWLVN